MIRAHGRLVILGTLLVGPGISQVPEVPVLWDAHVHLSLYGVHALDSLRSAGIAVVRDCGSNPVETLRWRDEIRRGVRRGPRIYTAGWIIDGPKDAGDRLTVRTPAEAIQAVDSLKRLGVDFIKTHNAVPREAYFAVLRGARDRGLKVVSHLPRGVPAWEAADSGVSDIEHAAESMLASPIYAGVVKTVDEAVRWWQSAAGDSAIARLARQRVAFTPTLARYAATIDQAPTPELREGRRRLLPFLVELTGRFYRAGITILAGSDFAENDHPPGLTLRQELEWLARAGLPPEAVRSAASSNLERWLEGTK
jgi:hypothetical protein